MLKVLESNALWFGLFLTLVVLAVVAYKTYKFKKMIEIDKNIKRYDENGRLIQEGYARNIWDYSFFPGLSKIWFQSEWPMLIAMISVLGIFVVYLATKDQLFRDLLGVNFGVVIGMLLEGKRK